MIRSLCPLPSYLPVGVFGLQSLSLDDVDSDQTLLDAVGRKLSELSGGSGDGGVLWQGVDLEHTLVNEATGGGVCGVQIRDKHTVKEY